MEVMKDVSLMHGYENGKHEGYENERKFLWCIFFCLRDNAKCFLSFCFLRGGQGEEETSVDGSGNVW